MDIETTPAGIVMCVCVQTGESLLSEEVLLRATAYQVLVQCSSQYSHIHTVASM